MKIKITQTIFSGNLFPLGDYDEERSAVKFADLLQKRYESEIKQLYPGAEISIEINIERAAGDELEATIEPPEITNDLQFILYDAEGDVYESQWDEWTVEE